MEAVGYSLQVPFAVELGNELHGLVAVELVAVGRGVSEELVAVGRGGGGTYQRCASEVVENHGKQDGARGFVDEELQLV